MFLNLLISRNVPRDPGSQNPSVSRSGTKIKFKFSCDGMIVTYGLLVCVHQWSKFEKQQSIRIYKLLNIWSDLQN